MAWRPWTEALREKLALLLPDGGGWSKLAWCLHQRRALAGPAGAVVWVRGGDVAWATWGARHGLFAIERMDGLLYLRGLARAGAGQRRTTRP